MKSEFSCGARARTLLSFAILLASILPALQSSAQSTTAQDHSIPVMRDRRSEDPGAYLMQMASGTSMNPPAGDLPMRMQEHGPWMTMLMGQAFVADVQQTGPRGHDKVYSTNWFMYAAQHSAGKGAFLLSSMFSLEPATISNRSYPELFQTGETAYGVPLVDAQHPHNFVMGLGAHYAYPVGERGMAQVYYGLVGDPALGPVAFPHRASAQDLPQAPLGHHWEDSTHIAENVATVAVSEGKLRAEASGFYGTEPGENRWTIEWGPMNSWSARVSAMPNSRWLAQVSAGRLTHPERQQAGDVVRTTASISYAQPMANGRAWATSVIWGRNHETASGRDLNAYLAETVWPFGRKNALTGRVEIVAKDELFANTPALESALAATAGSVFQVKAYTGGYTRILHTFGAMETAAGANFTAYGVPVAIQPYYGSHPFAANMYIRFRLAGR